jgi:non-canonical (house-cleaning) NTP pyrophosphatase
MAHESRMAEAAEILVGRGYEVETPLSLEGKAYGENLDVNAQLKQGFIDKHFAKIDTSEAILVINEAKNGIANYIGGNTLIEIAYAYSQGLDIFLLNPVPEVGYADEIFGMSPIILNGSIEAIDVYVRSLPKVMMSTTSVLKHTAVSRAFRKVGISVQVDGMKVPSGVAEQPSTMDETYEGAMNRHRALKEQASDADYFVTIESGLHKIHANHSLFGCNALIVEKAGQELKLGMDIDIEFPKEMLDRVPSEYPDIGVLVQEEFGSLVKDPYPYFTNGKMTRLKTLENSLYNVVIQIG